MTEPLVLLPGHMCDARLFTHQIDWLASKAVLHLAKVDSGRSIEEIADQVLQNAPPSFALSGLSFGGIVAMEMFRRQPHRITRIALMDTNHLPETAATAAERKDRVGRVREGHLRAVIKDEMKQAYLADSPNNPVILDLIMRMALDLGEDVFIRQSEALASRADQTKTLQEIDIPCLILCGAEDRLCSVARHEEMAAIVRRSRFAVIEGAGHLPPLEQPDKTNKAISKWLEEKW